ncbi:uncharacterized protein LOC121875450 [Homarus americanus]|uniref:uncharacterized protein LOC121875450 n=1 Tax=Homarus americanus TaxID=6706 RepID=UPI001C47C2DB|nr:uncharacterized protein LOC121875450 [Homarus americanus]
MVTVLATSSPATLLFLLVMVGVSTARPGAPPSHVEDIRLIVVRLFQQARSLLLPADLLSGTTFWGDLLKLLHLFGITNEDIFQWWRRWRQKWWRSCPSCRHMTLPRLR